MKELKIEYKLIDDLKEYKNNAKIHTDEQIKQIAKSIKDFGFNDPIAIDENNTIIEGHGRLLAAKELGMTKVPVIKIEGLTDQQKKAYIIAHNKLVLTTGFDFEKLTDELNQITDFDMTDFGFGNFELDMLCSDLEPDEYDKELIDTYSQNSDNFLACGRVIISYKTKEEEEFLQNILGLPNIKLKVRYNCKELMKV